MPNAPIVASGANRRLDTARVHQRWVSTASLVNEKILRLHKLSLAVSETGERSFMSECVASIEDVNDAIHQLHIAAIDPRVRPWLAPDSPLAAYLSAAYSWCEGVLGALAELLALRDGELRDTGERALARRSSEYVRTMLEPLFQRLGEVCIPTRRASHPLGWIYNCAERVESEIACLDWELKADEEEAEDAGAVP